MSKLVDWLNENCRLMLIVMYGLALIGVFVEWVMEITIITAIMLNVIVSFERIRRDENRRD